MTPDKQQAQQEIAAVAWASELRKHLKHPETLALKPESVKEPVEGPALQNKPSTQEQDAEAPTQNPHAESGSSPPEIDIAEEWAAANMPEFVQPAAPKPYATIIFRVATAEDLEKLAKATSQKLTAKTKSAWFPLRGHQKAKRGEE